ncbi:MAG: tetratricopeptide repeat protein [Pirellulales bacterium]|nr:tetratricopeptide repeat protein [Pirellulales bacterium]
MAGLRKELWITALLVVLPLACYWPVAGHTFVEFDDTDYVVMNPMVRNGLSRDSVAWAFRESHSANWHPLTWLSHMLDVDLFGIEWPGGHHLVALGVHVVSGVVLFWALRALLLAGDPAWLDTRKRGKSAGRGAVPAIDPVWCCGVVAALFLIHPQHVESVAWISERKDVLSGLFWNLALWAYAGYVRGAQSWARYALVALCLALGLMCKAMPVTLPAVLLLLDIWPLGRWPLDVQRPGRGWLPPWPLVREKLPLFGLVVLSSVITFISQRASGAVVDVSGLSLADRLTNACRSYLIYLRQMIWPLDLAFFYPHPARYRPDWDHFYGLALLALGVLVVISGTVLWFARRYPFLLTGWLWYLGTLVPVIGIVQVGDQARADRYTYIPMVGIYLLLAFGAATLLARRRQVAAILAALIVVACCLLTYRQQATWADTVALANQGLKVVGPKNYMSWFMLGVVADRQGRLDEAEDNYRKALAIAPNSALAIQNMAKIMLETKRYPEAERYYRRLRTMRDAIHEAWIGEASALAAQGKYAQAEQLMRKLLERPDGAQEASAMLALMAAEQEDFPRALQIIQEAIDRFGPAGDLLLARGSVYKRTGRYEEAAADLTYAAAHCSDSVKSLYELAEVRLKQNRLDDVIALYRQMLLATPGNLKTKMALAALFEQVGRPRDAIRELEELLELQPDHANAANNLAWMLATHRDATLRNGAQAVAIAERAARNPVNATPALLDTLAAAYAEAGRFADAVRASTQAIQLARQAGDAALADDIATRLALYQAGRPYHQP